MKVKMKVKLYLGAIFLMLGFVSGWIADLVL
jgi:hypothetical protein